MNNISKTQNQNNQIPRAILLKLATYASVFTALALIIAKIAAFVFTGSMAILATVVDSCLDLLASFINLLAVRQATLPADHNHRFGHGKFEPLAGLGQAAFVFGSGLFLLLTSIGKIGKTYQIENISVGISVMLFSIVMTAILLLIQLYVIKKTKSVAIQADKAHYTGDLLINASVIISLIIANLFSLYYVDIIFAIIIALYLLYTATNIIVTSTKLLADSELPDEERKKILDIIIANNKIVGVHDLRTRSSGDKTFIQFHLEINRNLSLFEAHAIADEVEQNILVEFPNAEVLIHEDPSDFFENHPEICYQMGDFEKKGT